MKLNIRGSLIASIHECARFLLIMSQLDAPIRNVDKCKIKTFAELERYRNAYNNLCRGEKANLANVDSVFHDLIRNVLHSIQVLNLPSEFNFSEDEKSSFQVDRKEAWSEIDNYLDKDDSLSEVVR